MRTFLFFLILLVFAAVVLPGCSAPQTTTKKRAQPKVFYNHGPQEVPTVEMPELEPGKIHVFDMSRGLERLRTSHGLVIALMPHTNAPKKLKATIRAFWDQRASEYLVVWIKYKKLSGFGTDTVNKYFSRGKVTCRLVKDGKYLRASDTEFGCTHVLQSAHKEEKRKMQKKKEVPYFGKNNGW